MQPGERRFAERLESHLEDDYLCWYDIGIGNNYLHPDFTLLHPGRGLLILEVKDWNHSGGGQGILHHPHRAWIKGATQPTGTGPPIRPPDREPAGERSAAHPSARQPSGQAVVPLGLRCGVHQSVTKADPSPGHRPDH